MSQEQIEANKENAQKSTGPKTEEGKNASRLNATKHGITSNLLSEYDYKEVESSINDLINEFGPRNARERIYFEQVISSYIRCSRTTKMEKEIYDRMVIGSGNLETQFLTLNDASCFNPIELANRYYTAHQNRLYKALEMYFEVRKQTDEQMASFGKKEDTTQIG